MHCWLQIITFENTKTLFFIARKYNICGSPQHRTSQQRFTAEPEMMAQSAKVLFGSMKA